MSGQETPFAQPNKPRSRRTHRRYYNEKRFDAPRGEMEGLDTSESSPRVALTMLHYVDC